MAFIGGFFWKTATSQYHTCQTLESLSYFSSLSCVVAEMAMRACVKRLQKEIDQLPANTDESIKLVPSSSAITEWTAVVIGPPDSYYEGYEFDLAISVPAEYPLVPPLVTFKTKIFHPNVYFETGEICLDILKKEWSPAWSLHSVCRAIIAMLEEPAADSPLNCDAGNMLRENDIVAYRSMTKMYCIDECRIAKTAKK